MINVGQGIVLQDDEVALDFVQSPGPGGQNVNKVATTVQLRFCVAGSASLPAEVKRRLTKLAGRRMTKDGVLVLHARRYRRQSRNREDAIARLVALVRQAATAPRTRVRTRPTAASRERRLRRKRTRSEQKRLRQRPLPGET